MKPIFLTIAFANLILAQQVCPPTPAWQLCEITLPATDPTLRAEFRGPSHRTFLIPSFTESGQQHLRFVPTEPGTWDYRITSADPAWNTKEGTFTATASNAPGYIEIANVHHFRYTASKQPHLWAGDTGTHTRILATTANDASILAIHKAGKTADLILPSDANIPAAIARFGALNITWQVESEFESQDREAVRKRAELIKAADQYRHLISSGTTATSGPLAADGWLNYLTYRSHNGDAPAIEHQVYQLPAVNDFGLGLTDTDQFRQALWRTTMDGAYPASHAPTAAAEAQMQNWIKFMSATRHWELEPFFDAGGRRALALEGVEYIVYIEQPGPVTVTVEKHNYDVAWFNPINGETIEEKKNLKTETFTGDPPDTAHDWVLHISREGHKAGMLRSYKFESREILPQELEANPAKVPFEISLPAGESISLKNPGSFAAKLTKDSKATKAMRFLWTAEVTADGQSYRVVGTGREGQLVIPPNLAKRLPALLHLKVEGLNGVGKLYTLDRNYQLIP